MKILMIKFWPISAISLMMPPMNLAKLKKIKKVTEDKCKLTCKIT